MDVEISGPTNRVRREQIVGFLRAQGYVTEIQPSDQVFGALLDGDVVGAVRLATESGVMVLRGMRVRSDVRRRGLGTQMLKRLDVAIGSSCCYCVPYAWLTGFYGTIGFRLADPLEAPQFLLERVERYTENGRNVVLMVRP